MCADKADESEHKLAADKASREAEEKSELSNYLKTVSKKAECNFNSLSDENGIIYLLGSIGKRRAFENPGKKWMMNISTSSLQAGSDKPSEVAGRRDAAVGTNVEEGACITFEFTVALVSPNYYTIQHSSKSGVGALRSWALEVREIDFSIGIRLTLA